MTRHVKHEDVVYCFTESIACATISHIASDMQVLRRLRNNNVCKQQKICSFFCLLNLN